MERQPIEQRLYSDIAILTACTLAGVSLDSWQAGTVAGCAIVVARYMLPAMMSSKPQKRGFSPLGASFHSEMNNQTTRYIKRPWRDFFGSPKAVQVPAYRPPMVDRLVFKCQGFDIPADTVYKFCQWAWANNDRGRGLSERSWGGNDRTPNRTLPNWWRPVWYRPVLWMIAYAEQYSGVQLVVVNKAGGKILVVEGRGVYSLIKYAQRVVNPALSTVH